MDQHIVCSDCGSSFLFSAAEATVFEDRGLASPKRCKDCRRARKERGAGDGGNGRGRGAFTPARTGNGSSPARRPRESFGASNANRAPARGYTGDVNEYRSPMQDTGYSPPAFRGVAPAPAGRGARRVGPPRWNDDGNYRAPSSHVDGGHNFGDNRRPQAAVPSASKAAASTPTPRRRPQAEMFSITCNSCGAQSEVPFKPAEGRDVYCQACYRARKPA